MRYPTNDPKYDIELTSDGPRLVNAATGKPIPGDEPIFIFRGKDAEALPAIQSYRDKIKNASHVAAVNGRIADFENFRNRNPDRMKQPDTAVRGS